MRLMNNQTCFQPRINRPLPVAGNQIAEFGVPGIPFPEPVVATPVFSQGEDVIYDGVIFVDGAPIDPSKWAISVVLKKSEYAIGVLYTGVLGNGLYYTPSTEKFQIWIPAAVTSAQPAGTYWFDILLVENAGANAGPKPRTIVAATYSFSLNYTMTSPNPDTDSNLPHNRLRPGLENTYPNGYNPLDPAL